MTHFLKVEPIPYCLVLQHRPHQCQSFICCQGPDLTFTKWQEDSRLEAASIYVGHPRS